MVLDDILIVVRDFKGKLIWKRYLLFGINFFNDGFSRAIRYERRKLRGNCILGPRLTFSPGASIKYSEPKSLYLIIVS